MRKLGVLAGVLLGAVIAAAQQGGAPGAPNMTTFRSAADVAALIEKARSERKEGQPLLAERLLSLAPYNANLEYRTGTAPASVHEKEAELFYVIDGSGTLVTGGTLTGERRTNAANRTGTGIDGGSSRSVSKGDFIIVPENTPHWFQTIHGTLILMSIHMPRPVAGGQ